MEEQVRQTGREERAGETTGREGEQMRQQAGREEKVRQTHRK